MGLKRLPSQRLYWSKDKPLFYCPVTSQLLTRDRFELITRCLHVANAPPHVKDHSSPSYDKLHKLRWMLDEVRGRFMAMWTPNQQMTVDEGMVMYKGMYCPIRQYMPRKPIRFGLKVWVAVDALSKYLWNFEVYCGKTGNPHDDDGSESGPENDSDFSMEADVQRPGIGEGLTGRNVVKDLLKGLSGRGHIVTTDNYFTSVPLFLDLLGNGTMATGTLRANRKYTPKAMFSKKITKKQDIEEGNICCSVWKDKQAVVLLSTHAEPVPAEGERPYVWKKFQGRKMKVRIGPMHLQYTRNMRGVDTADQLRGVYTTITRTHKWWHRLFFYMLDTTIVNMWIIHSDLSFRFLLEPMTHLDFQLQLAKDLASKWAGRKHGYSTFFPYHRLAHGPKSMGKKEVYVGYVARGQIKDAHVAKSTFARDFAIGTITGRILFGLLHTEWFHILYVEQPYNTFYTMCCEYVFSFICILLIIV
jgi:hypothetical protein